MDKRYQVFLSSTFMDLKAERDGVIRALMDLDCFPAAMEAFPAQDEDIFEFIKKVIDDCDYYIIILAGRYGAVDKSGIGYTEREYDYAVEKGIPVLAFVHSDYRSFVGDKTDLHSDSQLRLFLGFREKLLSGRMGKMWSSPAELVASVVTSLSRQMKVTPGVGWVRGDTLAQNETLLEINELRKENSILQKENLELREKISASAHARPNLAPLEHPITLKGTYRAYLHGDGYDEAWSAKSTFLEVFSLIAPELVNCPLDTKVDGTIATMILNNRGKSIRNPKLDKETYQTIKIQLEAHNLITVSRQKSTSGGYGVFWVLTEKGKEIMLETRTIKSGSDP